MSFQVGSACYASYGDAGGAACSLFVPVTTLDASNVRTVSCFRADAATGALVLHVTTTSISTHISTVDEIWQVQSYPDCVLPDYIAAGEVIFGLFLTFWALSYGVMKVIKVLDWSRGEPS